MIRTNEFQTFRLTFQEVCPPIAEIRTFLQSDNLGEEHPVNIFITDILPSLNDNSGITGSYIIKELQTIDISSGNITVENTTLYAGKQVCGYLKNATHIALFLCTAGNLYTKLSAELNQRSDFMESFIVDAIGSLTVEKAMDYIQQNLSNTLLSKNIRITNRYSPGYCNWPLTGQQDLFRLIGTNPTSILLSESSLMNPVKSVSGIIGIGTEVKQQGYRCNTCRDINCIYRKILGEK